MLIIGAGAGAYEIGNEILDSGFRASDLLGNGKSSSKQVSADLSTGEYAKPVPTPAPPSGKDGEAKKPDSHGKLQREVEKGQAPKEVDRVDKPHNPNVPDQKPHVHFKDGTSLNNDGTIHDIHNGIPSLNKKILKWLENHNWKGNQ